MPQGEGAVPFDQWPTGLLENLADILASQIDDLSDTFDEVKAELRSRSRRSVPLVHRGIGRQHRGDFDRFVAEIRAAFAVTEGTPETLDPEASEDDN